MAVLLTARTTTPVLINTSGVLEQDANCRQSLKEELSKLVVVVDLNLANTTRLLFVTVK